MIYTSKHLKRRAFCAVLTALAIAATSILLSGCSFLLSKFPEDYAQFTVKSLTLTVGDSYDLSRVIDSNTSSYVIEVDSTSILGVRGKTITAKAVGRTTVTAKTNAYYDSITVVVNEREEDSLSLISDGEKIQTVGSTSAVKFTPDARGSLRGINVDWYVNEVKDSTLQPGTAYSFTPTDAGKFTVKAVVDGYSAQSVVRAYYEVEAYGSSAGSLDQTSGEITAVTFSATVASDLRNPTDYIKWVVDGTTMYEGEEKYFRYVPSAGTHVVELYVNGVKRLVNGQLSATVRAAGIAQTPSAPTVTFDNVYPHVYVDYEIDGEYAEVEITLPGGSTRVISQADNMYASLFEDGRFDAQDFITVCATGLTKNTYGIRVRSLGDGDLISESDYSDTYSFTQIDSAAKPYLETTVLDFDLYLTSEEEYIDVLEYYILYRDKTARKPRVQFGSYVAFGISTDAEAESLFTNSFEWAATSGSYDNISVTISRNVLTTSFTVSTVNRPIQQSYTGRNSYYYASELHAITPHINYDESKYRPDDYVFPIDLKEREETVAYTDELYFAVEHNTKPLPVAGSAADTVYQKAREALRMIVTDDMTDMEKAHAIYDWIMWKVTYDTPATEVSRNGEAYSAYYLEGVFGDGQTAITDVSTGTSVKYAPYAVCDGLSKAYTLMCNIEGIPCVRVAGVAGTSTASLGGHAWNKVYVNNAWYVVDITWGDAQGYVDGEVCELGIHDWLFLTDAQADPTHYEPYESNDSYLIKVPETTTQKYNVYKEMVYNGVQINCAIESGEDQAQRLQEIATLFAQSYVPRTSLYVPGCGTSDTPYTGLDVKFDGKMTLTESNAASVVRSAVRKVLPTANVDTYLTSDKDVLIILIS